MEHKKVANDIVAKALNTGDTVPFGRWRLACRSLLDIHEKRREAGVASLARQRLIEIIDEGAEPKALADAGETLGWLGDTRKLQTFAAIEGGDYDLEELGPHTIEPFEISRYPVTNSWFAEFKAAGGYTTESFWSPEGKKWRQQNTPEQPMFWDERRWKCPNAPVVGVCWYEADAFCRWLTTEQKDGHTYFLPSEVQWQAAAAGNEKRKYPWGKEITPDHCNYDDTKLEKTSAAGIFKIGQTPEGVADLAGNVWEWTASDYHRKLVVEDFEYDTNLEELYRKKDLKKYIAALEDKKRKIPVLRGGSLIHYSARLPLRGPLLLRLPEHPHLTLGFRCARI